MSEPHRIVQDDLLNAVRRAHHPVTVFLMKGVRLQGVLTGFDTYSLTLRRDEAEQLVYKHAITAVSLGAIDLPDLEAPRRDGDRQEDFLARRRGQGVQLYLVNGVALSGTLVAHDNYCLVLAAEHGLQLVFKHAVSTVSDGSKA